MNRLAFTPTSISFYSVHSHKSPHISVWIGLCPTSAGNLHAPQSSGLWEHKLACPHLAFISSCCWATCCIAHPKLRLLSLQNTNLCFFVKSILSFKTVQCHFLSELFSESPMCVSVTRLNWFMTVAIWGAYSAPLGPLHTAWITVGAWWEGFNQCSQSEFGDEKNCLLIETMTSVSSIEPRLDHASYSIGFYRSLDQWINRPKLIPAWIYFYWIFFWPIGSFPSIFHASHISHLSAG